MADFVMNQEGEYGYLFVQDLSGAPADKISEEAIKCLKNYDWPGNVRELENIIERSINFLDEGNIIKPQHLPAKITGMTSNKKIKNLRSLLEEAEKQSIIDTLIITEGKKTLAAKVLGISRTSLYEKMNKYNICS